MTNVKDFLKALKQMTDENKIKENDGRVHDSTLPIVIAMEKCGATPYKICGSNYFARWQTENLDLLIDERQLCEGMIVYKGRTKEDTEYSLPEKYFGGGIYEKDGEEEDYYHAGIVTKVEPLEITHLVKTKDGSYMKTDTKLADLREWNFCGFLSGMDYGANKEDILL